MKKPVNSSQYYILQIKYWTKFILFRAGFSKLNRVEGLKPLS